MPGQSSNGCRGNWDVFAALLHCKAAFFYTVWSACVEEHEKKGSETYVFLSK